ncbi:GNAT family N-acetyltransferase [Quadrisphaera setariae]|uniref:GNAT family N-acetyltransferase n=1 Tax=Quadrisphaera setariae TaxID=2593304 RepID=UPI001C9D60C2|nr:GNAT family N-acetyltransferase [Quadrisphaera setariae]
MAPRTRVRWAGPADVEAIDGLIRQLAVYEREPDAVEATPDDLRAALFGPDPRVRALVAEVLEGETWVVAGTAISFTTYSTWTGRHGTWLEDLFVRPQHRGLGLGRALLSALAADAVAAGHRRLEWSVLDWNTPAQAVYTAIGAQPLEEWTRWRLAGPELEALAASGSVPS